MHKLTLTGYAAYPFLAAVPPPMFIKDLPDAAGFTISFISTLGLFAIVFALLAALRSFFLKTALALSNISLTREDKINLIATIILVGFSLSTFYHYIMGMYLNHPYPYNTFLFSPPQAFDDLSCGTSWVKNLNPYFDKTLDAPSVYFPFGNVVFYIFSLFSQWASLFIFFAIFTGGLLIYNLSNLKGLPRINYFRNVFIFSFLTYPFLFIIDRGNVEGLLFVFLVCFIAAYVKGRFFISSLFLALAVTMKLFPATLLVLFLADKRYKEFLFSSGLAILITIMSLLIFKGGFMNNLTFVLSGFGIGHAIPVERGTSLATLAQVIAIHTNNVGITNVAKFMDGYIIFSLLTFLGITAYIILFERELWKRVALLVAPMLLLPNVSFDYKLIHIFFPVMLFINAKRSEKNDFWYALMFALLLMPKDYRIFPLDEKIINISIVSMFSNIFIIIVIAIMIVQSGIGSYIKNHSRPRSKEA